LHFFFGNTTLRTLYIIKLLHFYHLLTHGPTACLPPLRGYTLNPVLQHHLYSARPLIDGTTVLQQATKCHSRRRRETERMNNEGRVFTYHRWRTPSPDRASSRSQLPRTASLQQNAITPRNYHLYHLYCNVVITRCKSVAGHSEARHTRPVIVGRMTNKTLRNVQQTQRFAPRNGDFVLYAV